MLVIIIVSTAPRPEKFGSGLSLAGNSSYIAGKTFNNTNNIYKHTNQYSTDVCNNYKVNKTHNVKKTYNIAITIPRFVSVILAQGPC